jgi:soluble lytic murein transglycosylase-like protein
MILKQVGGVAALALSCAGVPAHADVLEIGPDGPRWIAGARAAAATPPSEPVDEPEELSADFAFPQHAVADAARQAGIVPAVYAAKVAELAERFDLSPTLIEALVWQESRWRANARSPVGAQGLAQLMPGTARYLGVNPLDPFANLEGGARYLREQMDRFDGDIEKALAAYNAGPGRVIKAGGIPRIRETQGYVAAIMGRLSDHSRDKN